MHQLLIVPDDLLKLELHASFLDRRGIRIRAALNGEEALAICLVWRPALVVFAATLSDMTGTTFVGRLRQTVQPAPLLLMITSSVGEMAPEQSEGLHDAHLVAPVDVHQLLRASAALLDLRQRRWPRVRVSLAVSLGGLGDDPTGDYAIPATVVDLSEGGARVAPRDPLLVGATGTVTGVLPGSQVKLVLAATVRALLDEMEFHYGLEFVNLTDEQRSLLRAFVQSRQLTQERNR